MSNQGKIFEALADRAYSEANGNVTKAATIFRSLIKCHGKEKELRRRLRRAGLLAS